MSELFPRSTVLPPLGEYPVVLKRVYFARTESGRLFYFFDMLIDVYDEYSNGQACGYSIPILDPSGPSALKMALEQINSPKLTAWVFGVLKAETEIILDLPLLVRCYQKLTKNGKFINRIDFSPLEQREKTLPSAEPSIEDLMLQMPESPLEEETRGLLPAKNMGEGREM